ncbi:aminotransferase class V-fold PLP-dependent enzyme [Paenibacillus sp. LMG 31461]|uniref:Aminotransferase class V-fold PLP-dependent enzyme n=1 Tax=Paenibacillus plantarum TaxID=2654975 RepID=A0ABX1XK08_9BACL|nr:cysteine desulfurase family protein [Paenibacillus plantarum]NOU68634.1 aminotransferase class V-fold PLP-dependent enzyme [Paenibacillus plantarum]
MATGLNETVQDRIYLDYNASTPIDPEVLEEMLPFLTSYYGNPSSSHWASEKIKVAIDLARQRIGKLLDCKTSEIVFTSGGSESNNHAIKGSYFANRHRGNHIITTKVEHPSVLNPCVFLESIGTKVTYLDVDAYGLVDLSDLTAAITKDTILVSIMHANNEVGTVQPLQEIAQITSRRGIILHTDAAQSLGKIEVNWDEMNVNLLTVAGHKLYAPKGVGALIIREGTEITPHNHGASHEVGRRAGTENVPFIVGLGKAADIAHRRNDHQEIQTLSNLFWKKLSDAFKDRIVRNGHPEKRLPNTLNVSFIGMIGEEILAKIPEIAATTGSACHTGSIEMSPVLKAMKLSPEVAAGTVRFSIGRYTTENEIERACAMIIDRIRD